MSLAILLATCNGEKYLEEQFDSLLNQTYSDFMVYVHDDGSTDSTRSIIKKYTETYPEKITGLDYPATGGAKNNFFLYCKMSNQSITCFVIRMMYGSAIK